MEETLLEIEKIADKAAKTIATPNWADILSVILSLLAVIVAGIVAWKQIEIAKKQNEISEQQAKIMDQQNKIAVFDKQYKVYDITTKCLMLSQTLTLTLLASTTPSLSNIRSIFLNVFNDIHIESAIADNNEDVLYLREVGKLRDKLYQTEFLFPNDVSEDIAKPLILLADSLLYLICANTLTSNGMPFEMILMKFCNAAEKVEKGNVLQKMKSELCLRDTTV